ncbi:MAG: type I pullulanase [Bacillaceae bacterium]
MLRVYRLFEAYLDQMDMITVLVPKNYRGGILNNFHLCSDNTYSPLEIIRVSDLGSVMKYECQAHLFIQIGNEYEVHDDFNATTDLQIGAVIRTQEFDEAYFYQGNDLGAMYTKEKTDFKVWAPTATMVKLRIYEKNGIDFNEHEMKRKRNGVWHICLDGDCEGFIYTYLVCVSLVWREAADPYGKAVTVNGERTVVVDMSRTEKMGEKNLPPLEHFTDAIIYEASIRDLTKHENSGVTHRGKYIGLTESTEDTALAYLSRLGITHVELLPFFDFEGIDELQPNESYNWGYNPLHFNVPEGSYATDPIDPYNRINELKQMIKKIHEKGIRVIMDVVYNHVYIRETSPFECIVPGYYFRHDNNGMPSNGSGCGNDIASERMMARKFIIDSVMYWAQEYGIDGFRFDLMGILDVGTMNDIRRVLDDFDDTIMTLGEGWNLNTPLLPQEKAMIANARKMRGISFFNDVFRDSIKGSSFSITERGFALGDEWNCDQVKKSLCGSVSLSLGIKGIFVEPNQTINYIECHDNYTLWDKLAISNSEETIEERKKRQMLATSMVLLSQGIPFLHCGQEFFRTKQGVENSYNASDEINQIDWDQKRENEQYVQYVADLIALRKSHGAFRLKNVSKIQQYVSFLHAPPKVIALYLDNVEQLGKWSEIVVIFTNSREKETLSFPEEKNWTVLVEDGIVNLDGIREFVSDKIELQPINTVVLCR